MQLLMIAAAMIATSSAVDFMGVDISQGCSDYIRQLDPKIDTLLPKVQAIETAAIGTSVEAQAKEANEVAKQAMALYKSDKQKKATDLVADKPTAIADLQKGKQALAAISTAPDTTPTLTRAVKDFNGTIDEIRTYARAGARPCFTDLRALRAAFKDVGAPQANVLSRYQIMMGYEDWE